jgi:hypothetical protein
LKDILEKFKLEKMSKAPLSKEIQYRPDGNVDTSILKEILDRVNGYDTDNLFLKNKILDVESAFKSTVESLMLNKYDYSNAQILEGNVATV